MQRGCLPARMAWMMAELAKAHAESEFEKYRIVQHRLFENDFDRVIKQIESEHAPVIPPGARRSKKEK